MNHSWGTFLLHPLVIGVPQGAVLFFITIHIVRVFLSNFLQNYKRKHKCADDSTHLNSLFESVTQYEAPEELYETWRFFVNSANLSKCFQWSWKFGKIFKYGCCQSSCCSNRSAIDVYKSSWPLDGLQPKNWKNTLCNMTGGIKPTSWMKLCFVYIKSKIFCNFHLWFDSNPSSHDAIWCNVVTTVISSIYTRFYRHVIFVHLGISTPRTEFYHQVHNYLTTVAQNSTTRWIELKQHVTICSSFYQINDCHLSRE